LKITFDDGLTIEASEEVELAIRYLEAEGDLAIQPVARPGKRRRVLRKPISLDDIEYHGLEIPWEEDVWD
jgi:hypothetical protein